MNITAKQGVCKFCGQIGVVEAPEISQDEIDELVTSMCICPDAEFHRNEKDRQQRILENCDRAKKAIIKIFDDKATVREMLLQNVEAIAKGIVSKVSVKLADEDLTASLVLKADGTVRVIRKETETRVEG